MYIIYKYIHMNIYDKYIINMNTYMYIQLRLTIITIMIIIIYNYECNFIIVLIKYTREKQPIHE